MPKWILLKHIQHTRYAYCQFRVFNNCTPREQKVGLYFVHITPCDSRCSAVVEMFFTSVSRIIFVSVAKIVLLYLTIILTSSTIQCACRVCNRSQHFIERDCVTAVLHSVESASECTHQFRIFTSCNFEICNDFQCSYDCIITHSATLNNNMVA